jgi:predicted Zn-dependent protease
MIRNKDGEAKVHLTKVYEIIMNTNNLMGEKEHDAQGKALSLPGVDFRMQTSRLLVELKEFKKAIRVLDTVIQEDDSQVESWYLLAFSMCKVKKYANANECIKNIKMLSEKQKITNSEFLSATEELEQTIAKELSKQKKEEKEDADMEGFETYSEEELSDDEV